MTIMKTAYETAQELKNLGVNRSSAIVALKKQRFEKDDIELAIDDIYETTDRAKADWSARVLRIRQLVAENKYTQKQIAEIVVAEGLFGGLASAKQCMPYIVFAQEWSRQENS